MKRSGVGSGSGFGRLDGGFHARGVLTDDVTRSLGNEGFGWHDGFLHDGSLGSLHFLDVDSRSGGNLLGTGFSAGLGKVVFLVTALGGGFEGVSVTLANDALDLSGNLLLEWQTVELLLHLITIRRSALRNSRGVQTDPAWPQRR